MMEIAILDRPAFVAILYVNRSGSTLLSRMLSDHSPAACILPELAFPVQFLLARRAGKRLCGDAIFAAIQGDPRFEALGLSRQRLREVCTGRSTDDLVDLFHALATAMTGRRVDTVAFKLETLLYVADDAAAAFPGLRFVHLYRDPRGVANSMLRTPIPEKPGFDMARGSLVYAARHWAHYIRAVRRLAARHQVISIRYEDLGAIAHHPELAELRLFLGGTAHPSTSYRIAALDAPLHAHIYRDFDPELTQIWRGELTKEQVAAVEAICSGPMRDLAYPAATPPLRRAALLPFYVRHGRAMARHYWRTLVVYLAAPNPGARLRNRLRLPWRV